MRKSEVIKQNLKSLCVNDDCYDIDNIVNANVKILTWKDHVMRMMGLGIISASILFIFLTSGDADYGLPYADYLPLAGFVVGALLALFTSAKYVFCIEYKHNDETGVQWVTIAKSRDDADQPRFQEQAVQLKQRLTA
ncbi:hypothetical protein [Salinivibrio sp. ES.052]|uniref:hypothetical protein n=1 Tax=Salinivibrio sp. ES.052 TaxID=1882823 RepID=UPI00092B63CB|nr:hypothetical protein [Salinivibrio sp. ES.052]SIN91635.1 hypothetical protein SAMN05444724_1198 [Salinivibrio sp. ES.052]